MFRLVLVCVMACAVSVQCGTILAPAIGKLVSEKVVEFHGNNVVHASAPLVATAIAPALLQQPKTSLVTEKTIEAHDQQVTHNAQHVAIPTIAARELAVPIYYSQLVAEKTVSNYGHSVQHVA